ncbi:hypothetical protein ABK040_005275 [Willaertia magna]
MSNRLTISNFNEALRFESGNTNNNQFYEEQSANFRYWTQYGFSFGIAIVPYEPPGHICDYCIPLQMGDIVIIKGEFEGWYKGEKFPNNNIDSSTINNNNNSPLLTINSTNSSNDSVTNEEQKREKRTKGLFPSNYIIRFDGSPNNPFSLNHVLEGGVNNNNLENRNINVLASPRDSNSVNAPSNSSSVNSTPSTTSSSTLLGNKNRNRDTIAISSSVDVFPTTSHNTLSITTSSHLSTSSDNLSTNSSNSTQSKGGFRNKTNIKALIRGVKNTTKMKLEQFSEKRKEEKNGGNNTNHHNVHVRSNSSSTSVDVIANNGLLNLSSPNNNNIMIGNNNSNNGNNSSHKSSVSVPKLDLANFNDKSKRKKKTGNTPQESNTDRKGETTKRRASLNLTQFFTAAFSDTQGEIQGLDLLDLASLTYRTPRTNEQQMAINNALIALGNVYPDLVATQNFRLSNTVDTLPNIAKHFQKEIKPHLVENWFLSFLNIPYCKKIIETLYDWNKDHFQKLSTNEEQKDRFIRVFEIESKMITNMIDYYTYQRAEDSKIYKTRMRDILKSQDYLLDEGASLFSEDLIVKKDGIRLTPDNTPLFDLYLSHWELVDHEKKSRELPSRVKKNTIFYRIPDNNNIVLELNGCSYSEKLEWRFCLFDSLNRKFISEEFTIITAERTHITEDDDSDGEDERSLDDDTEIIKKSKATISALFKDISKNFLEKEQLVVLIRVYKFETVMSDTGNIEYRVPFALAVSPKLNQSIIAELVHGGNFRQEIAFYTSKKITSNLNELHLLLCDEDNLSSVEKADILGVEMVLGMHTMEYTKLIKQIPQITKMPLVNMVHLGNSGLSDEIRNDIYINLDHVVVKTQKNLFVEANLYVKDKEGRTVQCDLNRKQRSYRSPFIRSKIPKWNEIILLNISSHQLSSAILVFNFYVISSKKNVLEAAPSFFAFWPIEQSITNRNHSYSYEFTPELLVCYSYNKHFTNIHSFELDERAQSKCAKKARLHLNINVISTSITINPRIKELMNWTNLDEDDLFITLKNINYKVNDITTFFREIMSAFIGISTKYGKIENNSFVDTPLVQHVFEKMCSVMYPLTEQTRYSTVIEEYISKGLQHTCHRFILFYLNKFFDKFEKVEISQEIRDKLNHILKCLQFLLKMIASSSKIFNRKNPKEFEQEHTFIQNEMSQVIVKLSYLIKKNDSETSPFKALKGIFLDMSDHEFFDAIDQIFSEQVLGQLLTQLLFAFPTDETNRKITMIESIVKSKTFKKEGLRTNLMPIIIESMQTFEECFLEKKSIGIMNTIVQILKCHIEKQTGGRLTSSTTTITDTTSVGSTADDEERKVDESISEGSNSPRVVSETFVQAICDILSLANSLKGAFNTSLTKTEDLEADYATVKERIDAEENNNGNADEQAKRKNLLLTIKWEADINQSRRTTCDIIITILNILDLFTFKDVLDSVLAYQTDSEVETIEDLTELICIVISKKNNLPKNWIQLTVYQYTRVIDIIMLLCLKMKRYITLMKEPSITKQDSFSLNSVSRGISSIYRTESSLLQKTFSNRLSGDFQLTRFVKLFQSLVRQLFDTIFAFEPERMPAFDRKQFLQQSDIRANTIYYFYETIWSNIPFGLQQSFVPDLIDKIMRLFKLSIYNITLVAKNLFYDMLKIEFRKRKSLSLSEAATERCFIEIAGLDDKFKKNFMGALEAKLNSFKDRRMKSTIASIGEDFPIEVEKFVDSLHHLLKQVEEIEKSNNDNNSNTISAQSQENSFRNALKSFKKNNNMQLYYKYLHLLANLQKSKKRYVEAALAILKHASNLSWTSNEQLPFFSDSYPEELESKRKAKLYHECIDLFDKGKDWERAISLTDELREYYKKTLQYNLLSTLHSEESKLYKKIVTNIRDFDKYYFVGFFGQQMINTCFIFNAHHQKLSDFVNVITSKFKNAVIKREVPTLLDESKSKISEQPIIFVAPLEPSSEAEFERYTNNTDNNNPHPFDYLELDASVSPKIHQYLLNHNVSVFKRIKVKKVEEQSLTSLENSNDSIDTASKVRSPIATVSSYSFDENSPLSAISSISTNSNNNTTTNILDEIAGSITFIKVKKQFPNIYTIQRVTERQTAKLTTMQVAIYYLEQKIHNLHFLVTSHKLNESSPMTASLDSELTGLIDPRIHGGIYKDVEKYLTPTTATESRVIGEDKKYLISLYKNRLSQLTSLLKEGLIQRRRFVSKQNLQMSNYLEKKFKADFIPLLSKYGVSI